MPIERHRLYVGGDGVETNIGVKTAALYIRTSDDESDKNTSQQIQLIELKRRAAEEKWHVFDIYIDNDGEQFKRLLDDARAKKFDAVAVMKLDRLSGNSKSLVNILNQFDKLGITVVSNEEGFNTSTPYGKYAMHILQTVTGINRAKIKIKVKDIGHVQTRAAATKPLFGYLHNSKTKQLEINEAEARIVQDIFRLYVSDGLQSYQIAKKLNEAGVKPSPPDKKWDKKQ
jgi:site-specific DNA recombinase